MRQLLEQNKALEQKLQKQQALIDSLNEKIFETPTKELWRLSLGLGYRWSQSLVLKTEYSFEQGKELDSESRDHENFFGVFVF